MKMKKISKVKIALITLTAIVALVVVKVLTAQFLYTEMGYSPVETQQEFRNALSVSPFTATAFNNGYTYEWHSQDRTSHGFRKKNPRDGVNGSFWI